MLPEKILSSGGLHNLALSGSLKFLFICVLLLRALKESVDAKGDVIRKVGDSGGAHSDLVLSSMFESVPVTLLKDPDCILHLKLYCQ